MANKNHDIVFRRIRGRVVPVKKKEKDSLGKKALIHAGISGVSIGAGMDLYRKPGKLFKFKNFGLKGISNINKAKKIQSANKIISKLNRLSPSKSGLGKFIVGFGIAAGASAIEKAIKWDIKYDKKKP